MAQATDRFDIVGFPRQGVLGQTLAHHGADGVLGRHPQGKRPGIVGSWSAPLRGQVAVLQPPSDHPGDNGLHLIDGIQFADTRHPVQEAAQIERRLSATLETKFDELLFLKYRATNEEPYPFGWVDSIGIRKDYGAALVRISNAYEARFGG